VYGFSAGSQSAFLIYRLLTDKSALLGLDFETGAIGAVAWHPIYFYDFKLHKGASPLNSDFTYVVSVNCSLARLYIVHHKFDKSCRWMPSEGEIDGIRKLGFFVIVLDLEESAQDFGRNCHSYSQCPL
jgi:hypothetical protein